jgi:hypothetical protein
VDFCIVDATASSQKRLIPRGSEGFATAAFAPVSPKRLSALDLDFASQLGVPIKPVQYS